MKIHPAILTTSIEEYKNQIESAESYTNEADIDIIDWTRTNTKTISIKQALNITTSLKLNLDLMMNHPMLDSKYWISDPKINRIIINTECKENLEQMIDEINSNEKKPGLSLNPEDNPEDYKHLFSKLNLIQVFTIQPGAQGNKFLLERLKVINTIKKLGFKGLIETDGGFNQKTLNLFKKYPIDICSVGSALSKAINPKKIYDKLIFQLL